METIARLDWGGGKIDRLGIYSGVPLEIYHGDPCVSPSISSSGLRTIWSDSPAHYWAFSPYNPNRFTRPTSDAFDLGAAAHHWLLGEADFTKRFVIAPYDDFRSKKARQWRDAERSAGRTVLKAEQMEAVRGMRDGLLRNPLVREGILDGEVERSLFGLDGETGIWVRARPDVMPASSGDIVDLKTTVSVRHDDIANSIAEYGYHVQAGVLRMVCRMIRLPFTSFSFVFVEKTPPFCTRVVTLKDEEIDRGERIARASLRMFADCMRTGNWPGPGGDQEDAIFIETPSWHQQRTDARLAEAPATIMSEAAE